MLKNYIKSALRNIARHKGYSAINVLGLAIGVACFALIFSYVDYQISFDHYNTRLDRIYRLATASRFSPNVPYSTFAWVETRIASIIDSEYPEVTGIVRFTPWPDSYVVTGGRRFVDKGITFSDSTVFDVFTFPFVEGTRLTALSDPHSAVITKSASLKYFKTVHSIGKSITIDINKKKVPFVVSGVLRDVPRNSDLKFDILIPFRSVRYFYGSEDSVNCYAYLLLKNPASAAILRGQLPGIMRKYSPDLPADSPFGFILLPLRNMHLHSHLRLDWVPGTDVTNIYILSAIAIIVLLVAGANFTNIGIAQYLNRVKETGVRKSIGATRTALMIQFVLESTIAAFVATVAGITLAEIAMPAFRDIAGEGASGQFLTVGILLPVLAVGLTAGIVSGLYPAFYLSSFTASSVLRNPTVSGSAKLNLRKALVVFQFLLSIGLVISMIVIEKQFDFMKNKDLGFDKNAVVDIKMVSENMYDTFRSALLGNSDIRDVGVGMYEPGETQGIARVIDPANDHTTQMSWNSVDAGFFSTLRIKLVAGKVFSKEMPSTLHDLLLNQSAVKALGWHSAICRRLIAGPDTGVVIGVVEDVYFSSLRHEIRPSVYWYDPVNFYNALIRISPGNLSAGIKEIHSAWDRVAPDSPFEFHFLDQDLDRLYRSEERLGSLFGIFGGLAIVVGCLGLFGLASFSAERRTKEIGIRKVLGASIPQMVLMLVRDFAGLILLANLIAWPLAYYAMHRWLESFAYRVNMNIWIFLLAAAVVFLIAMATISVRAVRAARANPVKSLRYE